MQTKGNLTSMASIVSADRQDQLDEVELLQAMSKEGEFDWDEDDTTGIIMMFGMIYVAMLSL